MWLLPYRLTIILVNVALIGFTLYCFSLAGLLGNNEFGKVRPWEG